MAETVPQAAAHSLAGLLCCARSTALNLLERAATSDYVEALILDAMGAELGVPIALAPLRTSRGAVVLY